MYLQYTPQHNETLYLIRSLCLLRHYAKAQPTYTEQIYQRGNTQDIHTTGIHQGEEGIINLIACRVLWRA